jgi:hypothetical protein
MAMLCCACGSKNIEYDTNPHGLPVIGRCSMGAPLTGEPGACRCRDCQSLDIDERTDDERELAELAREAVEAAAVARLLRARVAELEGALDADREQARKELALIDSLEDERDAALANLDVERTRRKQAEADLRQRTGERDQLRTVTGQLMSSKDSAYTERNRCVAAIARLAIANGWRAGLGSHQGDDLTWDPEWRTIVFIDLPAGQVSWHLHDGEVALFEGLPPYAGTWDGHTTEEKYARVAELRRWRSSSITAERDAALATVERVRARVADQCCYCGYRDIEAALAPPGEGGG